MSRSAESDAGVLAPRCPRCGWQAIDREDTPANYEAAKADVIAHKAECADKEVPAPSECRRCGLTKRAAIAGVLCEPGFTYHDFPTRPIPPAKTTPTPCATCTDPAELTDCRSDTGEQCGPCHIADCAACQDVMADEDAASARTDGRAP